MADAWVQLRCYPILISSHRKLPLWAVSGCYPTPFLPAGGLPIPTHSDRCSAACDFMLPTPLVGQETIELARTKKQAAGDLMPFPI